MDDGGLGDFWGAPEENTAGICAVELEFLRQRRFSPSVSACIVKQLVVTLPF